MNDIIYELDMLYAQKERLQKVYEYYKGKININHGMYKTPRLSFLAGEVFGFSKTTLAKCLLKLVELGLLDKEGEKLATYTLPDSGTFGGANSFPVVTASTSISEPPVCDSEIADNGYIAGTTDVSVAPVEIETHKDIVAEVTKKVYVSVMSDVHVQMVGAGHVMEKIKCELSQRIDELSERIDEIKVAAEIDETEAKRLKLVNVLDGLLHGLQDMSDYTIDHHGNFETKFGYPVEQTPIAEYPEAEKWVYGLIKGYKE